MTKNKFITNTYGVGLDAYGGYSVVFGRYNNLKNWVDVDRYAFTIGNGKDNTNRSNALTLDWDGNLEVQTSVKAPCAILISPDGTKFKIKVSNDGTLITEKVVE